MVLRISVPGEFWHKVDALILFCNIDQLKTVEKDGGRVAN